MANTSYNLIVAGLLGWLAVPSLRADAETAGQQLVEQKALAAVQGLPQLEHGITTRFVIQVLKRLDAGFDQLGEAQGIAFP